jgi:hypothetical protein
LGVQESAHGLRASDHGAIEERNRIEYIDPFDASRAAVFSPDTAGILKWAEEMPDNPHLESIHDRSIDRMTVNGKPLPFATAWILKKVENHSIFTL